MIKRCENVIAKVVKDTKTKTLASLIKENVKIGSSVMTDERLAYKSLHKFYAHSVINHSKGEYIRGDVHTNTIENFWAYFKKRILWNIP